MKNNIENSTTSEKVYLQRNKEYKILTNKLILKERIWEIDFLRSLPIIIVVLYHTCFDFYMIKTMMLNYSAFSIAHPNMYNLTEFCQSMFFHPLILKYFVPLFGGIFLFISGVSSSLTRSNLRRGLLLDLAALIFSIGTYVFSIITKEDNFIYFGILHQMGFAITIYALIELFSRKVLKREVNKYSILGIGIIILIVGIVFTTSGVRISGRLIKWGEYSSYVGYDYKKEFAKDPYGYLKAMLGVKSSINDWWPIFPYTGVVYIGIFVGKVLYSEKKKSIVPKLYFKGLKPFCFIGSHTIYIYLLHQPIIVGILFIIFSSMGGKFF